MSHYTQGKPYCKDRTWLRVDTYHSEQRDLDGNTDRLFALGPDDNTPGVLTYGPNANRQYHGNCSCCYLGFPHTTARHDHEAKGNW